MSTLCVGNDLIKPSKEVKNLGVWLDPSLTMNTHINKTCSIAFYHLYNLRRIRKYLSQESVEILIHTLIYRRIDYCNSLYLGLPDYRIQKVQGVQNAAARLVYNAGKYCHITPLLSKLHWLPIRERILFKILLITYKAVHGHAPNYIKELIAQFRYIKIQPKTIDLSTRLVGITTEFVGFIPTSLVLRSIVLG